MPSSTSVGLAGTRHEIIAAASVQPQKRIIVKSIPRCFPMIKMFLDIGFDISDNAVPFLISRSIEEDAADDARIAPMTN